MLNLQIKIENASPELVFELHRRDLEFRLSNKSKNACVQLLDNNGRFIIPDFLKEYYNSENLFINITECGGYDEKKGFGESQVVCGLYGEKIKPYYVPLIKEINTKKANGDHAFFSVKRITTVVTYNTLSGLIKVFRYRIMIDDCIITIKPEEIFKGDIQKLIDKKWEFVPAAEAAIEMANTHNCCDAHFIIEPAA